MFINTIKKAKDLKKNFYLKQEVNGIYGNVAWWVYCGDVELNITEYIDNCGSNEKIICFPSEADKEISFAYQRKFNCDFGDGFDNYINVIKECGKNNIPFEINAQWGEKSSFTVRKLDN